MSGASKKLMGTTAAGGGFTAIEDVFSTYLYTGNGSTRTITNDIDLAGEGGLVWVKDRVNTISHGLFDTERGVFKVTASDTTGVEETQTTSLTAFNSDGFTLGSRSDYNGSSRPYASWTFRKAPRFFDVVTYTGDGVAGRTVSHGLNFTPACIIVKRLDSSVGAGGVTYHVGMDSTAPENYYMELVSTGARSLSSIRWNDTAPTESIFTLGTSTSVNASGGRYVAYLFAHDPLGPSGDGSDGLIACGTCSGETGSNRDIDLGWEPQWVLAKAADATRDWRIVDNMRGFLASGTGVRLKPNTSSTEAADDTIHVRSTGFYVNGLSGSGDYIYIAIRRGPMRVPESGTEVFAQDYFGENSGGVSPAHRSGWPVDAFLRLYTIGGSNDYPGLFTRFLGKTFLTTHNTAAEQTFNNDMWVYNNGVWESPSTVSTVYTAMFRRAPNFFDVVAYTGNSTAGRTVSHSLGVAPEMFFVKVRNTARSWYCYHKDATHTSDPSKTGAEVSLSLNSDGGGANGDWDDTAPTDSVFTLSGTINVNLSGNTYIAYLFATLAGVSKVGSYTGNGSSQTINCGFTSGARFILIKRTDSTGDWYVWDTARGIVTGNDPHLSLNTTAAEVTSDDSIDPASSGFIVNQVAATNINVSSASYIFYAVS